MLEIGKPLGIKEFFVRGVDRFIIPEIQRDYVWSKGQVFPFIDFLKQSFESYQDYGDPNRNDNSSAEEKKIRQMIRESRHSAGIGFIYACAANPGAESNNFILIDGQQRITTIYLLLLCLAVKSKEKREDFGRDFMKSDKPMLSYKVRTSAERFFERCIKHILEESSTSKQDIKKQKWYIEQDYEYDPTIKSVIDNIEFIGEYLDGIDCDYDAFYEYLLDHTNLLYFETGSAKEGEELYLYMNARGKDLEDNEKLKALFLGRYIEEEEIEKADAWGKKWEKWQNYFWKKKKNNKDADIGFNNFLRCITALSLYWKDEKIEEDEKPYPSASYISKQITIQNIEEYINCLKLIEEHKELFCQQYQGYCEDWVKECIDSFNRLIFEERTDWFNSGTVEHEKMIFVWGILRVTYELRNKYEEKGIEFEDLLKNTEFSMELYRALRQVYVNKLNFISAIEDLKNQIDNWKNNKIIEIKEDKKHYVYSKITWLDHQSNQKECEELVWQIEDIIYDAMPDNKTSIYINSLVDFNNDLNIQNLVDIKESIAQCFDKTINNWAKREKELMSILLYYDDFSEPDSSRQRFDHWRQVIKKEKNGEYIFRKLLIDLIQNPISFPDLLGQKREKYKEEWKNKYKSAFDKAPDPNRNYALMDRLKWYDCKLSEKGEDIWQKGHNIILREVSEDEDSNFPKDEVIYNLNQKLTKNTPRLDVLLQQA